MQTSQLGIKYNMQTSQVPAVHCDDTTSWAQSIPAEVCPLTVAEALIFNYVPAVLGSIWQERVVTRNCANASGHA